MDPLPHQLEAVYDYLLKLARVRFLLADDAGAGKTIMAGLLIRELKLRGLAERVLIVCPSNLAFQWQRELREKFDEKFLVLKGHDIRDQFNLQCCNVLFNYDIPWNPNRLEQRMGRIHRYGQHYDCLIFNFVATNTIEGRVLQRLLDKLHEIRNALDDAAVFNVVGEVLPAAHIERVLRDYYAGKLGDADLEERLLREVDERHFRAICHNALEGLAAKRLNLEMLIERRARAQERRVVPETIARFIGEAATHVPMALKPVRGLTELLQKVDEEIGKAAAEVERGAQGAEGRLAQAENRHAELLARRDRRRQEMDRQRALSLQAVERLATALILPHPDRESPEVRRLQPNPETEAIAMRVATEYEREHGRQVYDVHEEDLGYDLTSLDVTSGELRLIEVKGIGAAEGTIVLTPNEHRVAEDRRDCYWLYVVTDCSTMPKLNTVKDPASRPWQPVRKVQHYVLRSSALPSSEGQ